MRDMVEVARCGVSDCEKRAVASRDSHPLCRKHFIDSCYAELETYISRLKEHRLREVSPESAWRFIHECMREADRIEQSAGDLDEAERRQLVGLILGAAELGCHVRRSPRRAALIAIRLHCEKPARPWEEETETRLISRYGALVTCQQRVEIDQRLRVVRMDNGREAHARVAWYQRKRRGQPEAGGSRQQRELTALWLLVGILALLAKLASENSLPSVMSSAAWRLWKSFRDGRS
jgi:hypothetical protein